jgi:hypothetical protein
VAEGVGQARHGPASTLQQTAVTLCMLPLCKDLHALSTATAAAATSQGRLFTPACTTANWLASRQVPMA